MDSDAKMFLSAYTAKGYISFFEQIRNAADYTYILSGTPGLGAGTLMNIISEGVKSRDEKSMIYSNQIIPDEINAVHLTDSNIFLTKRDNFKNETDYSFVRDEMINLDECIDKKEIANKKDKIFYLTQNQAEAESRAVRYLSAAAELLAENRKLMRKVCHVEKINTFAQKLAAKTIKKSTGGNGREFNVFFNCVNCFGSASIDESIRGHADKIYVIEDEFGAVSRSVLQIIRKKALESGFEIYTGWCGLHGTDKLEHILIPELKTAFCTSNRFHSIKEYTSRCHIRRFLDRTELIKSRRRLNFNLRAAAELISGAGFLFGEAFAYHQQLKAIYKTAFVEDAFWRIALRLANDLGFI